MQFTIVLSAALSLAGFAAATPPACVLNAIGVQGSDATDMEYLCVDTQDYVLGNLTEGCSTDFLEPAYEHYSSLCLEEAAVTVASLPSETSGSSSATSTSGSSSGSSDSSDSDSDSDSGSGDESSDGEGTNENAATGIVPSFTFAIGGLLVTGMTSVLFL